MVLLPTCKQTGVGFRGIYENFSERSASFSSDNYILNSHCIQGCTEAETHTDASRVQSKPQPSDRNISAEKIADGKELFQVTDAIPPSNGVTPATPAAPAPVLEIDDLDKEVAFGTLCRRKGCGITFVSDEVNRQGDGEGTVCTYHPLPVTFHRPLAV